MTGQNLGINERLDAFLAELGALREKYGLEVAGCGECGSPWVEDTWHPDYAGEHKPGTFADEEAFKVTFLLGWDAETQTYTTDEYP